MATALLLLSQIVVLFIYIAIGYLMFRSKLISKQGSKHIVNVLLYVVLPCATFKAFCMEMSFDIVMNFWRSFAGAALILIISIIISAVIFRNHRINNFGAAFSNAGFIGIPLVEATMGANSVIYVASMVGLLNALQWTYGQMILSGDRKKMSLKAIYTSPVVIAFILGIIKVSVIFPVPSLLIEGLGMVSKLNSPLAMILIGCYLGEINLKDIFMDLAVWKCSFVKLVIIPIITIVVMKTCFANHMDVAQAILISASVSVGANVAIYAQKLDENYLYAVKIVCLSTLLSIISMPLIMLLFKM